MTKRSADGETTTAVAATPGPTTKPTHLARVSIAETFGAAAGHALFVAADGTAVLNLDGAIVTASLLTETMFGRLDSTAVVGLIDLAEMGTGQSRFGVVTRSESEVAVFFAEFPSKLVLPAIPLPDSVAAGDAVVFGSTALIGTATDLWYLCPRHAASWSWTPPAAVVLAVPDRRGGDPVLALADNTTWMFMPEPVVCPLFCTADLAGVVAVDTRTGITVGGTDPGMGAVTVSRIYPFPDVSLWGTVLAADFDGHDVNVLIENEGGPELVRVTPSLGAAIETLAPTELVLTAAAGDMPPRSTSVAGRFVTWNGTAYLVA